MRERSQNVLTFCLVFLLLLLLSPASAGNPSAVHSGSKTQPPSAQQTSRGSNGREKTPPGKTGHSSPAPPVGLQQRVLIRPESGEKGGDDGQNSLRRETHPQRSKAAPAHVDSSKTQTETGQQKTRRHDVFDAVRDSNLGGGGGGGGGDSCHVPLSVAFRASLGSQVFSTPAVADLDGDGHREIVVTTGAHFVEAIDFDGHKKGGWPVVLPFENFGADPVLWDVDSDGMLEVVVATENGALIFIHGNGTIMRGETRVVLPLRVRKDWFVGLDVPGVEASMELDKLQKGEHAGMYHGGSAGKESSPHRQDPGIPSRESSGAAGRKLLSVAAGAGGAADGSDSAQRDDALRGWLTPDGIKSLELFLPSQTGAASAHEGLLNEPVRRRHSQTTFGRYMEAGTPLFSRQLIQHLSSHPRAGERIHGFVDVDPHILANPVIADLDGDGDVEFVVAVSYYFDSEAYARRGELMSLYGVDFKLDHYVATSVCVFGTPTRENSGLSWCTPLDMTVDTQFSRHTAYAYSPPGVVDADGDGKMEIYVANGAGVVYRIEHDGAVSSVESMFPIVVDSMFASPAFEDVDGDGVLDMVLCDVSGQVSVFSLGSTAHEIWTVHVDGLSNEAPVFGDLDADGKVDIVLATTTGQVWALSGRDGTVLAGFPVRLRGKVHARPLLLWMHGYLRIVVHSYDGHLYVIRSPNTTLAEGEVCVDRIDLGESSFSGVVAEDVTGNGYVDLVAVGRSGDVMVLSSEEPLETLLTRSVDRRGAPSTGEPSQNKPPQQQAVIVGGEVHVLAPGDPQNIAVSEFVNRWPASSTSVGSGSMTSPILRGVTLLTGREQSVLHGRHILVRFHITDELPRFQVSTAGEGNQYRASVALVDGHIEASTDLSFTAFPGIHEVDLLLPGLLVTSSARLSITLVNAVGQRFEDSVVVALNLGAERLFNWILILPVFGMAAFFALLERLFPR